MPPRTVTAKSTAAKAPSDTRPGRPVTITAVVDPVAALASEDVAANLYLYDTNRTSGSSGFGTGELATHVRKGDTLLWNVIPLECETFVALAGIDIDPRVAEPVRQVYPGTDIAFWTATVKRDLTDPVPYRLSFLLGTVAEPYLAEASPTLAGAAEEGRR